MGAGTRTAAALWGPFNLEELLVEEPDFVLDAIEDVLEINAEEVGNGTALPSPGP